MSYLDAEAANVKSSLHLDEADDAPPKPKRKRKPSMAAAARLAAREGVEVKIAPDGTIIATPVKPLDITPTLDTETANEWDRLQ